jgi:hypothetical protein
MAVYTIQNFARKKEVPPKPLPEQQIGGTS